MDAATILKRLESLGDSRLRELNIKRGASEKQFGVKMGDLRVLAKEIKTDHGLAMALWETANDEARLLATLIMKPKELSADELERLAASIPQYPQLADWLMSYVIRLHQDKEALRQRWMQSGDVVLARAGWSLTADLISKDPAALDTAALLGRIEAEMAGAPAFSQWTMNTTLATIGIYVPELRERALAIGEKLGVLRDYPVSKGCTSPFAPIWINEIVRRQGW